MLYSDLAHIEGGQGLAVLRRVRPRWQAHLGHVFEEAARWHAQRLVARGHWPARLVVGRWWAVSGEPCEIDVLGLDGRRTALLGEAGWQAEPLGLPELEALRRKAARAPEPVAAPIYALWCRAGLTDEARRAGAEGFDLGTMLKG